MRSPDGQFVAFFADGKLKKVAVAGGSAVDICDAGVGYGGTQSQDDVIIFASGQGRCRFNACPRLADAAALAARRQGTILPCAKRQPDGHRRGHHACMDERCVAAVVRERHRSEPDVRGDGGRGRQDRQSLRPNGQVRLPR